MIADLKNLSVSFGGNEILKNINLKIEDNDRIGLIGANGAGKSTLLNVICKGIDEFDGELNLSGKRIGYLKQNPEIDGKRTIDEYLKSVFADLTAKGKKLEALYEEIAKTPVGSEEYRTLSARYAALQTEFEQKDGYNINIKINTVKNGMGFDEIDASRLISTLSGGEKTRLNLIYLLLSEPDLLILDEPTNHLDFKTLSWLESYLASYKGAILMVSHDRYFLDKCVTETAEIYKGRLTRYKGNYSAFKALKAEKIKTMEKEYQKQQEEIASLTEYIAKNSVRASTAKSAQSRRKILDKMEILEKPTEYIKTISLKFDYTLEPVKDVLKINDIDISAGERVLLKNFSLNVRRGEKIAFVGKNGIGKSTLLKKIMTENPDIVWGMNTKISYFEQETAGLHGEKTVFQEIHDRFPSLNRQEIRSALGKMLISDEDIFKNISMLSGGEKAKVKFAIMTLTHGNVLILDEPTNHLDLPSKEALDEALGSFTGTLLTVSHDRYLLNSVPDKIIEINDGGMRIYNGNYDYYIKEKENESEKAVVPKKSEPTKSEGKFYRSKEDRAKAAKLKKIEKEIEETENKISLTEAELSEPKIACDFELLNEKCSLLEELKNTLNGLYEKWEEAENE